MTETAGPRGGPPPSAGRGLWSEAFREEMRGKGGRGGVGGVNTAVISDTHTHTSEIEFKSKQRMRDRVWKSTAVG